MYTRLTNIQCSPTRPLDYRNVYGTAKECKALSAIKPKTVKYYDYTTVGKIGTPANLWPMYYKGLKFSELTPLKVGLKIYKR